MQEYKIFIRAKDEDGQAVPHALVTARLNLPDYTEAGVKFPMEASTTTDETGFGILELPSNLDGTAQSRWLFEITSTHQVEVKPVPPATLPTYEDVVTTHFIWQGVTPRMHATLEEVVDGIGIAPPVNCCSADAEPEEVVDHINYCDLPEMVYCACYEGEPRFPKLFPKLNFETKEVAFGARRMPLRPEMMIELDKEETESLVVNLSRLDNRHDNQSAVIYIHNKTTKYIPIFLGSAEVDHYLVAPRQSLRIEAGFKGFNACPKATLCQPPPTALELCQMAREKVEAKLETCKDEKITLENQVETLVYEKELIEQELEVTRERVVQLEGEVVTLTETITEQQAQIETLTETIVQYKTHVQTLTETITQKETEIQTLTETLQQTITEYQDRVVELEGEVQTLTETVIQKETVIQTVTEQVNNCEQEKQELEETQETQLQITWPENPEGEII